jgi:hypothetical protein
MTELEAATTIPLGRTGAEAAATVGFRRFAGGSVVSSFDSSVSSLTASATASSTSSKKSSRSSAMVQRFFFVLVWKDYLLPTEA